MHFVDWGHFFVIVVVFCLTMDSFGHLAITKYLVARAPSDLMVRASWWCSEGLGFES